MLYFTPEQHQLWGSRVLIFVTVNIDVGPLLYAPTDTVARGVTEHGKLLAKGLYPGVSLLFVGCNERKFNSIRRRDQLKFTSLISAPLMGLSLNSSLTPVY